MFFLNKEKYKCVFNNLKKEITIKLLKPEYLTSELQDYVNRLKEIHPNYFITLTIEEKYKIDNLLVNEIFSFKNHLNQNLQLLIKIIDYEEIKTKNKQFFYNIICELPEKRRFIKSKIFSFNPISFKKGAYYYANGKIESGNEKYIKKNEKLLGKENEFLFNIKTFEEYDYSEKINEKKYKKARQELHSHTLFSKRDGFITQKDIEKAFDENKIDQFAITDHGAVFAFIPFVNDLKEKYKGTGKRLLLGSEFYAIDFKEHNEKTAIRKIELEEEIKFLKMDCTLENDFKEETELLKKLKEEKKEEKKILNRKTSTEENKNIAIENLEKLEEEIKEKEFCIKELKREKKEQEILIEKKEQELSRIPSLLNKTDNVERDHITVILKTKDSKMNYRGEEIDYNPGLVELYKLISKSYLEYFSCPTIKELKMYGKRPTIPYSELFKEGIREHFVINSACAFGRHMKLALKNQWVDFKEFVKKLDAVEIQPLHNNIYMINHQDYPTINSLEDLKKLHKDIYNNCKEVGVKCIFTSDAHVNDKEDRELRSLFKLGYINQIKSTINKKVEKIEEEDEEEEIQNGDEDFSIETQPFILSYEEALEDLNNQGFSQEEALEIMNNTKEIADMAINGFDITILPKKMFLGDFPGINVKEEVPKLTWEYAINKWSKDGTKDGIEPIIKERIEVELNAIKTTGYEILYYISYLACKKSEEMGYTVGSRGSAGSMMVTFCLQIGTNNPLEPHYFCPKCKKVEWVKTELVGLDLPTKFCECGTEMENDGCAIEAHNFLGWNLTKSADIDLNFSSDVQAVIHNELKQIFGEENMIKSGTQAFYQADALKTNVFRHIPKIQEMVQNEEFDIDYYAHKINTMNTNGIHPGGLLLKPNEIPFELITPLVFASNDNKKSNYEISSFIDYHSIEDYLPKIDALGHATPTMLKELEELTGFDYRKIKFNDPNMFKAILDPTYIGLKPENYPFKSTTMGIPEMNSDFTMKVLEEVRPENMTDLIYFSGVTHGTGCWQDNVIREKVINREVKLQDGFPVRDIIFQQLVRKFNWEPSEAFIISESVRKGKGIKKWEKELREKLPEWLVESMEQIKYCFPKAHALSYVVSSMQIYYYKLNFPLAFYVSVLNKYGVNCKNNSNINYISLYNELNTKEDLFRKFKYFEHASDNPTKIKDNKRIASIMFEAKLRGIKLKKANLTSSPMLFDKSSTETDTILMPLKSVEGIGETGAKLINKIYKILGKEILNLSEEQLSLIKLPSDELIFDLKNKTNKKYLTLNELNLINKTEEEQTNKKNKSVFTKSIIKALENLKNE